MATDKLPDDDDLGELPQGAEPEGAEFGFDDDQAIEPQGEPQSEDDLFVLELEGDVKEDVLVDDVGSTLEITGQGPTWRQIDAASQAQIEHDLFADLEQPGAPAAPAPAAPQARGPSSLDVEKLVTFSESGETTFGGRDDELDGMTDLEGQAPSQIVENDIFEATAETTDHGDAALAGNEAYVVDDGSLGGTNGGEGEPASAGDWDPVEPGEEASPEEVERTLTRAFRSQEDVTREAAEDPIYGEEATAASLASHPVFSQNNPNEPNYKQLAPILREAEPQHERVVVVAPRRRRILRALMATAMTACLLVIGLVTFVTLRPDVPFSQSIRRLVRPEVTRPAIEVAMVARPKIALDYDLPALAGVDTTVPVPRPGGSDVDPLTRQKYDRFVAGLGSAGRVVGGAAVGALRQRLAMAARERASRPADPRTTPVATTTLPVPPDVVGTPALPGAADPVARVEAPVRRTRRTLADLNVDITRGSQLFVQLDNGNFFVGRVQKVQEEELTLIFESERGEISFFADDMHQLLPVADAEARVLQAGPEGYVRLKNKNKLWGKILDSLPDVVTIQTTEARIVIPKESILEVSKRPEAEVRLGKEEEEWADESKLPTVEPQVVLPKVDSKPDPSELPAGSIRVDLTPTTPTYAPGNLPRQVRGMLPAGPNRK